MQSLAGLRFPTVRLHQPGSSQCLGDDGTHLAFPLPGFAAHLLYSQAVMAGQNEHRPSAEQDDKSERLSNPEEQNQHQDRRSSVGDEAAEGSGDEILEGRDIGSQSNLQISQAGLSVMV